MNLPTIDLGKLPDLDKLTGIFGSLPGVGGQAGHDDSTIILGTYVFEVSPGGGGLF
jgi:hypothetical protein